MNQHTPILSIIIVNYNVRYFLEQALYAVRKATEGLSAEVFVVDNNSVDTSCEMVREKFPEVILIANKQNTGFSVANNQAIRVSKGKYVLLLNPDTVVQEDTFHQTIAFMEARPDAGGLGIRMIDGSGVFLPESKRGFPSPWVAFCKTVGLSAIFPKSRLFNHYYLGFYSEHENCEIDVLAGAFMLMRRAALDKVGLLDEAFFMYGEDIDLSYRIVQGGYRNYYFADSTIIHYKGESTKKGSLNYVRTFYEAMIIFARKHFSGTSGSLFVALLQAAIYFRAAITLLRNWFAQAYLPFLDAVILFGGLIFLKNFWANNVYHSSAYYSEAILYINFPLYIFIWLTSVWISGGYDERGNISRLLRGIMVGSVLLLAVYGLLELEYRSSRALVVLGAVWASIALPLLRFVAHFLRYRNINIGSEAIKNTLLVADTEERERVQTLLNQSLVKTNLIGNVAAAETVALSPKNYLGTTEQLDEMVRIYKINEIIFCAKNIPSETIMRTMSRLGTAVEYKIVPPESWSIIGSSDKNSSGELYTFEISYQIATPINQRNKRFFDVISSILLFFSSILLVFFIKNPFSFIKNIFFVLLAQKTWVGYERENATDTLPKLRPAVLSPADAHADLTLDAPTRAHLSFLYAKDYTTASDLEVMWRSWRSLGNRPRGLE